MIYVVDASVAAEYLLRTELGLRVSELLEDADLIAPSLLDVEVLSILRRAVLGNRLRQSRAEEALEDLALWPVERLPPQHLLGAAWSHRHNLNAYDACYVAAARVHDATLLTADGPLARAQSLGCVVHNVRLS